MSSKNNRIKTEKIIKDYNRKLKEIFTENLPNFEGISFEFEGDMYQSTILGSHNAKKLAFALNKRDLIVFQNDLTDNYL